MSLRHDYRSRPPEQVRVVVFGATGYIGRFVVNELVERGYQVIAFARERSGIGGRQSRDEVIAEFPGAEVRFGDCLLYTSPSPRDRTRSRMPSSA